MKRRSREGRGRQRSESDCEGRKKGWEREIEKREAREIGREKKERERLRERERD